MEQTRNTSVLVNFGNHLLPGVWRAALGFLWLGHGCPMKHVRGALDGRIPGATLLVWGREHRLSGITGRGTHPLWESPSSASHSRRAAAYPSAQLGRRVLLSTRVLALCGARCGVSSPLYPSLTDVLPEALQCFKVEAPSFGGGPVVSDVCVGTVSGWDSCLVGRHGSLCGPAGIAGMSSNVYPCPRP